MEQESPYMLFYELQNIDELAGGFHADNRQGACVEIGQTEDDREFEETLKKTCAIQ